VLAVVVLQITIVDLLLHTLPVVLVEDLEIILDLLELIAPETVDKVADLLHHRQQ
jgi:hypothetical protein